MNNFISTVKAVVGWLSGKKTYIVAVVIAIVALLQVSGVNIPEPVYVILSALGLGSLRASVPKK